MEVMVGISPEITNTENGLKSFWKTSTWLGNLREGRDDFTKPGSLGWVVTKEFPLHLWRSGKGFPDVPDSQSLVPRLLREGWGCHHAVQLVLMSLMWCRWLVVGVMEDSETGPNWLLQVEKWRTALETRGEFFLSSPSLQSSTDAPQWCILRANHLARDFGKFRL